MSDSDISTMLNRRLSDFQSYKYARLEGQAAQTGNELEGCDAFLTLFSSLISKRAPDYHSKRISAIEKGGTMMTCFVSFR